MGLQEEEMKKVQEGEGEAVMGWLSHKNVALWTSQLELRVAQMKHSK